MGVYLSSPVTEKDSVDEQCDGFSYGASSMQGWRITQEDAHNCLPSFDAKTRTSFFAVYDGHGGSEVAKYCERHFPGFVKNMIDVEGGAGCNPAELIKNAFLAFDATLTNDDVIKELKELAGKDDDNEEEEDEDPVGRSETDMLREEANMPLDQLLAQYQSNYPDGPEIGGDKFYKQEDVHCPVLKQKSGSASDSISTSPIAENSGSSSSSLSTLSLPSSSSCVQDSSSSSVSNTVEGDNNSSTNHSHSLGSLSVDPDVKENHAIDSNINNNNKVKCPSSNFTDVELSEAPSSSQKQKCNPEGACTSQSPGDGNDAGISSLSTSNSSSPLGSSKEDLTSKAEPSGSGTSSRTDKRTSKTKEAAELSTMDGAIDTSDDDEDDEDLWEDMSEDEEDDDDDDEDDEDEDCEKEEGGDDVPMMDMTNEEPGSDSGCTACVVLMQGKKLIVANAGDSRCVLARAGKAVELSFDHKPEDDSERERIEKAGGKVTADGRVNGGLNLSRAIGDHVYKQNKDLPAEKQMITALPDVETAELCDEDQFVVIACDGIWNYMSSQEVVDYVLEKLRNPEKRQKPSIICEELFDHCLAPNTFGDGTGCDNMTCVIVVLDSFSSNTEVQQPKPEEGQVRNKLINSRNVETQKPNSPADSPEPVSQPIEKEEGGSGTLKRCADDVEVSEGKRLKLEEEVA